MLPKFQAKVCSGGSHFPTQQPVYPTKGNGLVGGQETGLNWPFQVVGMFDSELFAMTLFELEVFKGI